ncbi:MAG: hypothetical protein ACREBA_11045 [Nitrosotalea sp.]
MNEIKQNSENTMKKEYLGSYDELRKPLEMHRENSGVPNLVCCDVKKYQEAYGKELISIIKSRQRLEDFINKLE